VQTLSKNPIFGENRMKLGIFGFNGRAPSHTILDELYVPRWPDIVDIGTAACAAGFEALVPFARWKTGGAPNLLPAGYRDVYDPFIWAAGLGQATRHPAVMATAHMSLMHPIIVAKQGATIDQVSGGRFALNVVAGWNEPEFRMFGGALEGHTDRYAQAGEWLEVLTRFWQQQEDFDFEGQYYTIRKGESLPKPQQAPMPPIMNAGGSDKGRAFAAKYADLCFTLVKGDAPEAAAADVSGYRDLARRDYGRGIQVWTIAYVIQRDTEQEARRYQQHIIENADITSVDAMMAMLSAQSQMMSAEAFQAMKNRYICGAGGFPLVGTADTITDTLRRLAGAGIDGVMLCWVDFADGLARWNRDIMPRLEQLGLRHTFRPDAATR
jgi:alkanesulfonate monooxygenase SsuD/methylene tetrahydromethanopterin reductase-like flavin-dependent oxidoreductase (luciferase family)